MIIEVGLVDFDVLQASLTALAQDVRSLRLEFLGHQELFTWETARARSRDADSSPYRSLMPSAASPCSIQIPCHFPSVIPRRLVGPVSAIMVTLALSSAGGVAPDHCLHHFTSHRQSGQCRTLTSDDGGAGDTCQTRSGRRLKPRIW